VSPLADPLEGVRLKVKRAVEHYDTLKTEIRAFFDSKPYEVTTEYESKGRRHVARIHIKRDPPPVLGLLIGECLYQLRTALDHLAWQLASIDGRTPPETTEFPIFKDRPKYERARDRKMGSLPKEAQDLIDGFQPCDPKASGDPAEHPLWLLHRLTNDDKHQRLHLVFSTPLGFDGRFGPQGNLEVGFTTGPFQDGDEIGWAKMGPPGNPQKDVQITSAGFALAFPPGGTAAGKDPLIMLDAAGREVDAIITALAPFVV
jgi:hypothetical protein